MKFDLPTTKAEMYNTLQEIFHYYRIKREGGIEMELQPLVLPRMNYTPLTDTQLTEMAKNMVKPAVEREKYPALKQAGRKKDEIQLQIDNIILQRNNEISIIERKFNSRVEKVEADALKRGTANSTIVTQEIAKIEDERSEEISKIISQYEQLEAKLVQEIEFLNTEFSNLQNFYYNILDYEAASKKQELILEQEKIKREVEKYNTGLDEAEQKYQNSIIRQHANLELKFKELNVEPFSKDQLVEMGYYEDVIDCVCGYFDTLPALEAYQEFNSEKKLTTYLDDYYVNVLYMYRVRAGQ